ncbi:unnamed protein product [Urochloa humidicola]
MVLYYPRRKEETVHCVLVRQCSSCFLRLPLKKTVLAVAAEHLRGGGGGGGGGWGGGRNKAGGEHGARARGSLSSLELGRRRPELSPASSTAFRRRGQEHRAPGAGRGAAGERAAPRSRTRGARDPPVRFPSGLALPFPAAPRSPEIGTSRRSSGQAEEGPTGEQRSSSCGGGGRGARCQPSSRAAAKLRASYFRCRRWRIRSSAPPAPPPALTPRRPPSPARRRAPTVSSDQRRRGSNRSPLSRRRWPDGGDGGRSSGGTSAAAAPAAAPCVLRAPRRRRLLATMPAPPSPPRPASLSLPLSAAGADQRHARGFRATSA